MKTDRLTDSRSWSKMKRLEKMNANQDLKGL